MSQLFVFTCQSKHLSASEGNGVAGEGGGGGGGVLVDGIQAEHLQVDTVQARGGDRRGRQERKQSLKGTCLCLPDRFSFPKNRDSADGS